MGDSATPIPCTRWRSAGPSTCSPRSLAALAWPPGPRGSEARIVAKVDEDLAPEGARLFEDHPAPAAGRRVLVKTLPTELGARAPVAVHGAPIDGPFPGDEAKRAGPPPCQLDERGSAEIEGVAVPEIHLDDAPPARDAGRRRAAIRQRHAPRRHSPSSLPRIFTTEPPGGSWATTSSRHRRVSTSVPQASAPVIVAE